MLIILLNGGHGNNTAGKRWTFNGKTFYEWEFNRTIVKLVAKELDILGIPYHIITPEDYDVPLLIRSQRVNDLAKKYGKDNCLLFSVHANASEHHNASGVSVWTSRGMTESDKYAEIMWNTGKSMFVNARMLSDFSDGDHDFEAGFHMVTKTICPAVLVESFFYDNKKDFDYLMSDEGKKAIVKWYVETIKKCVEYHKNK